MLLREQCRREQQQTNDETAHLLHRHLLFWVNLRREDHTLSREYQKALDRDTYRFAVCRRLVPESGS